MNGKYTGKTFDTDLSVGTGTYTQWRLPGLRSHVALTMVSELE